jgi:chitosanase
MMVVNKTFQEVISVNENGTPDLNYAYCENIGDGRGFTMGIAGWTSSDSDYQNVVSKWPDLSSYKSTSTILLRLRGLPNAWAKAAQVKAFRDLQDLVQHTEYFMPAIDLALDHKVSSLLGQLIFCDTNIQHGMDDDSDESPGLETMASQAVGANESDYLMSLLDIRRKVLSSNGDVWGESVGRVDALSKLVQAGNWNLEKFNYNPWGDDAGFIIG